MKITGRTAVVTGGASGIGRATAVELARRGAKRVHLVDLDQTGMRATADLAEREGAAASVHILDLADLDRVQSWFGSVAADCDILFNNAALVAGAPQFPESPIARLRTMVDVNLTAVIIATQIAAQSMRARGGGVIVNTVSTVALGSGFSDALYAATKTGLMMFTRCCAPLKAEWGVQVAGVLPGLTDTPILKKTGPDGDYAPWMAPILSGNAMCAPEDIADGVMALIENDDLAGGDWVAVRKIHGRIVRQWGAR